MYTFYLYNTIDTMTYKAELYIYNIIRSRIISAQNTCNDNTVNFECNKFVNTTKSICCARNSEAGLGFI